MPIDCVTSPTRLIGRAWDLDLDPDAKFLLLAALEYGSTAPAVLAQATGLSLHRVQQARLTLARRGLLRPGPVEGTLVVEAAALEAGRGGRV